MQEDVANNLAEIAVSLAKSGRRTRTCVVSWSPSVVDALAEMTKTVDDLGTYVFPPGQPKTTVFASSIDWSVVVTEDFTFYLQSIRAE